MGLVASAEHGGGLSNAGLGGSYGAKSAALMVDKDGVRPDGVRVWAAAPGSQRRCALCLTCEI